MYSQSSRIIEHNLKHLTTDLLETSNRQGYKTKKQKNLTIQIVDIQKVRFAVALSGDSIEGVPPDGDTMRCRSRRLEGGLDLFPPSIGCELTAVIAFVFIVTDTALFRFASAPIADGIAVIGALFYVARFTGIPAIASAVAIDALTIARTVDTCQENN